ncbi:MAG: hypothetical protein IH608_03295, partial [Proteobacteria bacterium]|nr:hypothetical protein [Pseudomonadota bacterium]
LELRGAGNLLGADQSGFASQVGLDAYLRLLEKTVHRLQQGEDLDEHPDPEISLAGSVYLPEGYVEDSGQKLHLYRRLSKVGSRAEVEALRREMADRFGPLPDEAGRLLDAAVLRVLGRSVGVERILVRDRSARLNFRAGVVPRVAALDAPLGKRQVGVEVVRMDPLSLVFNQVGALPLAETLVIALEALRSAANAVA